jgi:hypothetical protein
MEGAKMRAFVLMIMAVVALGACQSGEIEKEMAQATEAVSTSPAPVLQGVLPRCPLRWSCDDQTFFGSHATCTSHCQDVCTYGPECRPDCLCE